MKNTYAFLEYVREEIKSLRNVVLSLLNALLRTLEFRRSKLLFMILWSLWTQFIERECHLIISDLLQLKKAQILYKRDKGMELDCLTQSLDRNKWELLHKLRVLLKRQ